MSKGSKGKKGNGIISFGLGGRSKSKDDDDSTIRTSTMPPVATYTPTPSSMNIRSDSLGYNPSGHHHSDVKIESLTFTGDESEAFRAYAASQHYYYRGHFWNAAKSEIMKRYINLTFIGITQGLVAYFTNYTAKNLIDVSLIILFARLLLYSIEHNMILFGDKLEYILIRSIISFYFVTSFRTNSIELQKL
jgi:hypothetical protein